MFSGSIVNASHQLLKGRAPSFLKKAAAAEECSGYLSPRRKGSPGRSRALDRDVRGQRPRDSCSGPGQDKVCPRGTLARDGGRGPGGGRTTVDPFSPPLCLATLPWNQVSGGMRSRWLSGPGGRALCSLEVLGSCGQVKVLLESASRRWGDMQSKHAPNHPLSRPRAP